MTDAGPTENPGPDAAWAEALAAGRFLIQRCGVCGAAQWPLALVCRACGAPEPALVDATGRGTVHATTVVRDRAGDYNVCLIDLAEGPRLMARVESIAPEAVQIGMAVRARIAAGEPPVLVFDPMVEAG